MDPMDRILEIASRVSTPIALAGLIVGVLLLVFLRILRPQIVPQLDGTAGAQTVKSIIHWLGVLAVVGVLCASATSILAKMVGVTPEDSYRGNIPANLSLKSAARWVAETEPGFSVEFGANCIEAVLESKVSGGTLAAGSIARAIEKLPRTVISPKSQVDFRVTRSEERGLYEVDCL
jgi:hypothetical protein